MDQPHLADESKSISWQLLEPFKYRTFESLRIYSGIKPAADIVHPDGYFTIHADGWMTISKGYAWDGASGAIDTENFMRGSCAHDVPYQASQLRMPLPPDWKDKADKMLVRLTAEDGMWPIRCAAVYQAVKVFGRGRPRDLNKYAEIHVSPK